jgi:hypothetical protein
VLDRVEDAVHAEAPTQSHELGQFGSPSPGNQALSLHNGSAFLARGRGRWRAGWAPEDGEQGSRAAQSGDERDTEA